MSKPTPAWAKLIDFETTLPSPSASCSDAYKAAAAVGGAGYGRQSHRQRRRDSRAPATNGRSPRTSAPMRT